MFRREICSEAFDSIVYTRLAEIVALNTVSARKKTYNNITSAVRTAFKFGYRDRPGRFNPALALTTFRITSKDRPKVDPFTVDEAEAIISASHRFHGEWYGNYEEFRFFTGLRQSEQFALEVAVMERTYAAWIKGAGTAEVKRIRAALAGRPANRDYGFDATRPHRRRYRAEAPLASGAGTKDLCDSICY